MSFSIITVTLASDVADDGTVTLTYPTNKGKGDFYMGVNHSAVYDNNQKLVFPNHFELTFNAVASGITFTNRSGATLKAGKNLVVTVEEPGPRAFKDQDRGVGKFLLRSQRAHLIRVNLGQPITLDADAMIVAATGSELPNNSTKSYTPSNIGTSPVDGAAQPSTETVNGYLCWRLDVPRNVTNLVTHGSSIVATTTTIYGFDEYGNAMRETITTTATGTSKAGNGVKAFKWIRQIDIASASDSTANTVNVGFGDVLGLPVYLPDVTNIIKEILDSAAATAGTTVAGAKVEPTASSADVRGTYTPNSATNGSRAWVLEISLTDPGYLGPSQYNG